MKLNSEHDFSVFSSKHPLCAVYFSGPNCAVCEAMRPKLFKLLQDRFPRLVLAEVDCSAAPQLAAQQMVFTIPTLIVYLDGREGVRKSRSFSLAELAADLARPYSILSGQ